MQQSFGTSYRTTSPPYKYLHLVVLLYHAGNFEERGAYNLYVKPSAGLSEQNLGATSAKDATVRQQARSTQGIPSELAANEETGAKLAPDEDMPESVEEGLAIDSPKYSNFLKGPEQPTAAEIEQHDSSHEAQGHIPYRRWCPQCVSGRGVGRWPTAQKTLIAREQATIVIKSQWSSTGAVALPGKGGDAHATSSVVEFLQLLGHRRLVLQSDGEPAILALKKQVRAAAADIEIIPQESPPGDHNAAGVAENNGVKRVKGLARKTFIYLEVSM
eukprot:2704191-Amphidinium_carterae.3